MSKTNIRERNIQIHLVDAYLNGLKSWRQENISFPYWNLIHNDKGISEIFFKNNINRRRVSLHKETAIIIPPFVEFSSYNSSPISHLNLSFIINNQDFHLKDPFYVIPCSESISILLDQFHNERIEGEEKYKGLIYEAFREVPENDFISICSDNRIIGAINQMKSNFEVTQSNESLASTATMSVNGFARLFKEKMDVTPYEYQLNLRINWASILLEFEKRTIDEIACLCGFTNRFHFSKTFKLLKKQTPVQYKEKVSLSKDYRELMKR